jgi:hypothetical protein
MNRYDHDNIKWLETHKWMRKRLKMKKAKKEKEKRRRLTMKKN